MIPSRSIIRGEENTVPVRCGFSIAALVLALPGILALCSENHVSTGVRGYYDDLFAAAYLIVPGVLHCIGTLIAIIALVRPHSERLMSAAALVVHALMFPIFLRPWLSA